MQSPVWDGHTLHFHNLADKTVTVKVPPQHTLMFSFKDVHMRGTATDICHCRPSAVMIKEAEFWRQDALAYCELILLHPVLIKGWLGMTVFVVKTKHQYAHQHCWIRGGVYWRYVQEDSQEGR